MFCRGQLLCNNPPRHDCSKISHGGIHAITCQLTREPWMSTRSEISKNAAGVIFTGCGVTDAAPAQPGGRRRQVVVNGRRVKTIDVHAHCVIPETLAMMGKKLEDQRGPGLAEVGAEGLRALGEQGIERGG